MRHQPKHLVWIWGMVLLLWGCSSSRVGPLQNQLAEEQARRAALQTERDFLQAQVNDAHATRDSLLAQVQEQAALLTQLQNELNSAALSAAPPPDSLIPAEDQSEPAAPPPPAPLQEDLRTRYDEALNLYRQKQFGTARDLFSHLLASNFDGGLADNCQYWVGECYFAEHQYETAIAEFEKVFAFPRSNKIDAAQYKIGLSYVQLKKGAEAREAFSRLLALYPASEYVERARLQLDKIP